MIAAGSPGSNRISNESKNVAITTIKNMGIKRRNSCRKIFIASTPLVLVLI
jgi:hypothetical protein